jgi:hypothetical protein
MCQRGDGDCYPWIAADKTCKGWESRQSLRDQVVPVLLLLQATESHLSTGNVLLGVLEVLEEGLLVPLDALLLVGVGVGVALDGASLAAEEAVQSRADLVAAAVLDSVALGATGLEEVGTLLSVSCKVTLLAGCKRIGVRKMSERARMRRKSCLTIEQLAGHCW